MDHQAKRLTMVNAVLHVPTDKNKSFTKKLLGNFTI
jgi:hypothetical protein